MKCVICSSQDIDKKYVDEEIRIKNDVVMVNINTLVCGSCGERYYDSLNEKNRKKDILSQA